METGSLVFVNKNGERQGGKPEAEASCPSPAALLLSCGGRGFGHEGGIGCEMFSGLAFFILEQLRVTDDGLYSSAGGAGRLCDPVQLSTLTYSDTYRHVRTWEPGSPINFFFFNSAASLA